MRIIRRLFTLVIVAVVVLVAVAYVLPREVTVERSLTVNAAPESIFPYVNSMQATEAWSPWLDRDPDVRLAYSGPESGVGNRLAWESDHPQVGSGTQEITASMENSRVETALDFGPMGIANAWFNLAPEGTATEITWGFVTDTGMNPITRWMGLMMDRWVGADYEAGLAKLKALAEDGA